jgi:hypothetical protein
VAFVANCGTTAMGIMPHRDLERAMDLVLELDIPFWPQLPHISFYEDMYVQFSEHFPGIVLDLENKKLGFDTSRFESEVMEYSVKMSDPATFTLSKDYSGVYHRFLTQDLSRYAAIRGQSIGPVSFGFRVADENNRPIIYNDDVRTILFDFMQRKINSQYRDLREKNKEAFVWLDEPGLSWVFSGFSGYSDVQAGRDYASFFSGLEGRRALHLCANVNLPYLLNMGADLLSFDAFQIEVMPKGYADSIAKFINGGGILCWGIVPTDSDNLGLQTPQKLVELLVGYWKVITENSGLPLRTIARQALIAPARCCLKNIGQVGASDDSKSAKTKAGLNLSLEESLVEQAFQYLGVISGILRNQFDLA